MVEMLLVVEGSAIGVALKTTGILHCDAAQGVLAAEYEGNGSIVGYYYSSLSYEDVSSGGSCMKCIKRA